ncbi:MAG TPA: polysaccharide biosynthesis/export family protein [bacterium]|nr:polysaccharide biosynthesis/export family protein [bacterium]
MMNLSNTHTLFVRRIALGLALWMGLAPVLPLLAAPSSKEKPASKDKAPDYPKLVIGPGDILGIQVYGESGVISSGGSIAGGVISQLPTEYQVDTDGQIVFPFIGRLLLTGLTPSEASEKIARLLSKPRKVTVLIKESSTYWVSVLGNVARPGRFQIAGRPTLLSALSLAGGPLPDADMGGAILIHAGTKSKLNLDHYLRDTGATMTDPYLYPGDVLEVPKSGWPTIGEWAIIASILASTAVIVTNLNKK